MAERPLLALPQPDRPAPPAGRPPIEVRKQVGAWRDICDDLPLKQKRPSLPALSDMLEMRLRSQATANARFAAP